MRSQAWLTTSGVSLVLLLAPWPAAAVEPLRFVVKHGDRVLGRLDLRTKAVEDRVFAVSALYKGRGSVERYLRKQVKGRRRHQRKKERPARRSYVELGPGLVLGKYKRWKAAKGYDRYWFVFSYKKAVKVRYERGPGARPRVWTLGKVEKAVPLEPGQPMLAYLVARYLPDSGAFTCAGPDMKTLGRATVSAKTVSFDAYGQKTEARLVEIDGDCGRFAVYLASDGAPLLIRTGDLEFQRIDLLRQQSDAGKTPESAKSK